MRISDWSSDVCSSDLHRDQRRHEMFERVEPAVVGDMRANFDEPVIDARLDADRGFFDHVARPARDRTIAFEPDVERPADVALGRWGTARKFPEYGKGQGAGGGATGVE